MQTLDLIYVKEIKITFIEINFTYLLTYYQIIDLQQHNFYDMNHFVVHQLESFVHEYFLIGPS